MTCVEQSVQKKNHTVSASRTIKNSGNSCISCISQPPDGVQKRNHSDGFPETLEIVGKSTFCSICCPCRQISFQAALDARPCIPSNVYRKPLDSLVFLLGPTRRSAVLQGFTLTDLPISDGFPKTSIKPREFIHSAHTVSTISIESL